MDCSLPSSSVYGIAQAKILEWVAFPTPGDLPNSGIEAMSLVSPALAGRFLTPELPDQHEILVEPVKFPSVLGCSIFALL